MFNTATEICTLRMYRVDYRSPILQPDLLLTAPYWAPSQEVDIRYCDGGMLMDCECAFTVIFHFRAGWEAVNEMRFDPWCVMIYDLSLEFRVSVCGGMSHGCQLSYRWPGTLPWLVSLTLRSHNLHSWLAGNRRQSHSCHGLLSKSIWHSCE